MKRYLASRLDHLTDEQRKEYAIRHNRSAEMSAWDFDILAEELAALDIQGIDMSDLKFDIENINADDYSDAFSLKEGDREPIQTMSITFSDDEAETIKRAISQMKGTKKFKDYDNPINKNSNGNALFLVVDEWLQQKI